MRRRTERSLFHEIVRRLVYDIAIRVSYRSFDFSFFLSLLFPFFFFFIPMKRLYDYIDTFLRYIRASRIEIEERRKKARVCRGKKRNARGRRIFVDFRERGY